MYDLQSGGEQVLFDTPFTKGLEVIRINGLIWMGDFAFMEEQITAKINAGFRCIKMKIGAISWADELTLLKEMRTRFPKDQLELRVDANGAFSFEESLEVLKELNALDIHSIEQPIRPGQIDKMRQLCAETPCPIALDEELIGTFKDKEKKELLAFINPQYIILKPSLHGGISGTKSWIEAAERLGIKWWMTSALESNLGLNAIAQLASTYKIGLPQGLGTGSLYETNINSPLELKGEFLHFNPKEKFDFSILEF
jgi:o-succinylbenzoate synthase